VLTGRRIVIRHLPYLHLAPGASGVPGGCDGLSGADAPDINLSVPRAAQIAHRPGYQGQPHRNLHVSACILRRRLITAARIRLLTVQIGPPG